MQKIITKINNTKENTISKHDLKIRNQVLSAQ